ncbi:hypothetical protein BH09PAT2_BH09PAT2_04050 [soil metagenome]
MRQKHTKYIRSGLILLAGFMTIFVLNTAIRSVIYSNVKGMVHTNSPIDTILYNPILHTIFSFIIPILGGVVVGYLMKEKGWIYGGILAIVMKTISLAIVASIYFSPTVLFGIKQSTAVSYALAEQNIVRQLISLPFALLFIAWGGWVGEKLAKYRKQIVLTSESN